MIKYAVLDFRYDGDQFIPLYNELNSNGVYTVNVGDNIQSIAVRQLYQRIGIADEDIVCVNRDSLQDYDGEQIFLVMNGCFYQNSFPLSTNIIPIFAGFNTTEQVISQNKAFFKINEPIGCRDVSTTETFRRHNIEAFTTGCLTLTFPRRNDAVTSHKVFVVYGQGAGALPMDLVRYMPAYLLDKAEFIFQRLPFTKYPLSHKESCQASEYAGRLLSRYEIEAGLVITPLLHAASPCAAMGIPVVLARSDRNDRFTAIERLLNLYTPDSFAEINWHPKPLTIEHVKYHLERLIACMLKKSNEIDTHKDALSQFFDCPPLTC